MALSVEQAQNHVIKFCKTYRLAAMITYQIRETQEEIYGRERTKEKVGTYFGSFRPSRGQADFAAASFRDTDHFEGSLRHEILGHFGINTFTTGEKRAVLEAIIAGREQAGLQELWAHVDKHYPELVDSPLRKAEEVYAFACEAIYPQRPSLKEDGERAMREVCIRRTRPMQMRDLITITNMVAEGMRDLSRRPLTNPTSDQDQFKKEIMIDKPKKPFHETVAEKLIEQLKAGTAPWQRPWSAGEPSSFIPTNPTTGKRYKGINAVFLMSQGHSDQRWLTYKQAVAAGAQVRKGEKGTPIQYWKFSEEHGKTDAAGRPVLDGKGEQIKLTVKLERPRVFFATVFNAEQIDGLPAVQPRQPHEWTPMQRAEQILEASGAKINHSGQPRAFYRVASDDIHMPEKSMFSSADKYYAIAMHELGHWTGHPTRLDRDLSNPFGSEGYAKEELRAEIASMILGDEIGIGHDPEQHVAYVASWIKVLQDDPLEIFRAAADAEKIQDHILGLELQQFQKNAAEQALDSSIEVVGELRWLHEAAEQGFSPLVSWENIKAAAEAHGLTATIGPEDVANAPHDAIGGHTLKMFSITYTDRAGNKTGITTSLYEDGQALTRMDSAAYTYGGATTADAQWQRDALGAAALQHHTQAQMPQMLTRDEFALTATATRLENHGRRWEISFNEKGHGFSDAETSADALRDLHRAYVNNALWSLSADNPPGGMRVDAMPTDRVLAEYPDLKTKFADVMERHTQEKPMAEISATPTPAPGRLVDRLIEAGMPRDEAVVAAAWRDLKTGTAATLAIDTKAFQEAAQKAFGFTLPADWNGRVQVQGNIKETVDGVERVTSALHVGREPEYWSVYAQHENGMSQWLADFPTQQEAEALELRVAGVDAHAETNEFDQAQKLARINERTVRADPASTEEKISAAKESRKSAESAALLNDPEFQRRSAEFAQQERAHLAEHGQAATVAGKVYLDVPFKEKDAAKAMGAKWDRQEQAWYVPGGLDATPFAAWERGSAMASTEAASALPATKPLPKANEPASERIYLAVPYEDRKAASAAGAAWDKAAKSWYVGPNGNETDLERWRLDGSAAEQGPAKTPEHEFADALVSMGFVLSADNPVQMDGKKHRMSVVGEPYSKNSGSGFYVGYLDGHPAGYIKNNKTTEEQNWKAKGYTLDPEQRAQLQAEAAAKLQARAAGQAATHEATAQRVSTRLAYLTPATEPTPYLQAKGLQPQPGAFTDEAGKTTYIPAIDVNGKHWTTQYIQEDGTKRFAKDSKKEGCFHAVGGLEALSKAPALVIGEGYATAASLSQELGYATVAAFDSGNLMAVAKALHEKYPDKPVIIAGDNDAHLVLMLGVNPGKEKALEAAQATGGTAVFPIFAAGEQSYPAGLPAVTPELTVRALLSDEQKAAIGKMKQFTDFNDLATKSALGKEAIARQLGTMVKAAIEARQPQQQERVQQLHQRPQRAGMSV